MKTARRIGRSIGVASLLAVSVLLLLPAFTGHPVVSYASSGSMEPTIGVFDVFFVNPYPSDVRVDDIIVYQSITRGGPAVHRIVGGDATGWLTKGDANPIPDQDGAEPLVTRDRILGKVITSSDGTPILFHNLGITYVESNAQVVRAEQLAGGPRQLLAVLFLASAIVSGVVGLLAGKRKKRARPMGLRARRFLRNTFPRGILGRHVGIGLLLVLLAATAWSAAQARTDVTLEMVVVADPAAADAYRAQASGGSLAREIAVTSLGLTPTLAFAEAASSDVSAPEEGTPISSRGSASLLVTQRAGDATGLQTGHVTVWRYPAFLPSDAMRALHELAPGLPYAALAGLASLVGAVWFSFLGIASLPVGRLLGIREPWL